MIVVTLNQMINSYNINIDGLSSTYNYNQRQKLTLHRDNRSIHLHLNKPKSKGNAGSNLGSRAQDFKVNLNKKPESGDEKRYPNGTVVGKYTYLDDAGNPIEVKYYADEAGYGVELKSIKVVDVSPKMPLIQADSTEFLIKTDEPYVKTGSDFINVHYPPILKENNAFGYLNKGSNKMNRPKSDQANSDYDVYYKNELRGPKKWTNDKVRVYFDKDKRKTRNSFIKKVKCQD